MGREVSATEVLSCNVWVGQGITADGSEIRLIQLRLIQVVYPIIYRVIVKIPGDAEVSSIKSMLVFKKKNLSLLVLCCRCFLLAPDNDSRLPVTFSCFGVDKCHFYCSPGAWSSGMELNTGFVSRNACVGNVVFRF